MVAQLSSDSLLDQCIDQALQWTPDKCAESQTKSYVPDYHATTATIPDSACPSESDATSAKRPNTVSYYPPRLSSNPPVVDSVTELMGATPLIRLHNIEQDCQLHNVELFAKPEYLSAGGSVKDRIGRRMIELNEKEMKPGDYVIEATSGNTGIGLAIMCAVRKYRLIIVMPKKMSQEKENVLTSLGARVIRTRSSAAWNDPDSHIAIAYRLKDVLNAVSENNGGAKAFCCDQYRSIGNIESHYHETAVEIMNQMNHNLDYFVAAVGTGGTFTGISLRLKKDMPNVKCIAVDPEGSILHKPKGTFDAAMDIKPYEVEGIGYDFHPSTWNHQLADGFELINDQESFEYARKLISLEGLLCGGSSGSVIAGAIKRIQSIRRNNLHGLIRMVVILPDSIRNYLSKFASDDWMLAHSIFPDYKQHKFYKMLPNSGSSACKNCPLTKALKIMSSETLVNAYKKMKEAKASHIAVTCSQTHTLLSLLSDIDLEYELIKQQHNTLMVEYMQRNALYFVDQENPDLLRELHCVFVAQYGEGKIHNPAVIVAPHPSIHDNPVARREFYAQLDWTTLEVEIITSQDFINTQLI